MSPTQRIQHLAQVIEAGQEGEVIARHARVLRGHQFYDGTERGRAVAVARGNASRDAHFELRGIKGRVHVDERAVLRQPERVAIEVRRRERGGEQYAGGRSGETRLQVRRGQHVAQRERGARSFAAPLRAMSNRLCGPVTSLKRRKNRAAKKLSSSARSGCSDAARSSSAAAALKPRNAVSRSSGGAGCAW